MDEQKAARKATKTAIPADKYAEGDAAVLAKIAAMPGPYSVIGNRLQALILRSAGAPADRVVRHAGVREGRKDRLLFPRGQKYMTFGLTQDANLTREAGAPAD